MYNNFKINTFTKEGLIDLGYDVFIIKFNKNPNNSLFTSNFDGSRYLEDLGYTYDIIIDIRQIESENLETYLKLNGSIINFKQDIDDSVIHEYNCRAEPQKFNGKPFFNGVRYLLTSVEGAHESYIEKNSVLERASVIDPIKVFDENGQEFMLSWFDNDDNFGIINKNKERSKTLLLFEDNNNWITEDGLLLLGG